MKSLPRKSLFLFLLFLNYCLSLSAQNAWINEFHYDNDGGDEGEFVEVIIENSGSYNLSLFTLHLYNGGNSDSYDSYTIDSFAEGDTEGDFTIYYKNISGIQNGAPDGFSLDYNDTLIQFISYEGQITAIAGPANGETSVDIGEVESGSTSIGESLQLSGTGTAYSDFTWQAPVSETPGQLNNGQILGSACTAPTTQSSFSTPTSGDINDNQITLNWSRGNGDGVLILIKENQAVNETPQNGTSYTSNVDFSNGSVDEIGAGNFVVYDGTATSAVITGLTQGTEYHFAIFEYFTTDYCYLSESETIAVATTTSFDENSDIAAPVAQIASTDITSLAISELDAEEVFKFEVSDMGTNDGASTFLETIVIEKSAENEISDWSAVIKGAKINDGTSDLITTNILISQDHIEVDLTGNEFEIADGTTESLTLSIWLEETQTDGEIIAFEIPENHGVEADASGSLLNNPISSTITSNPFTIEVEATDFEITTVSSAQVNEVFNLSATAVDANGNTDLGSRNISLSLNTASGNLSSSSVGLGSIAMTDGFYEWTDLEYDTEESIIIEISDGNGLTVNSPEIDIIPLITTVFFSEYIEGSSSNKALEIFNNSGDVIDLNDFSVAIYSNGSESMSFEYELANAQKDISQLADQNVLVIGNTSADSTIQELADTTQFSITNFNGDDALALLYKGNIIDVIGGIGVQPSNGWEVAGIPEATQDKTLVRKASVTEGNSNNLASFGSNCFNSEWIVYEENDFSFLGSHFRCTPPTEQVSAFSIQNITESSAELNWSKAVGLHSLVLIREGGEVNSQPISGDSYAADTLFSSAVELGAGNKIIYAGIGENVTVSNLNDGNTYHIAAYAYDDVNQCYNLDSPATASFTTVIALDADSEIRNLGQPGVESLLSSIDQESEAEDVLSFQIADLATNDTASTFIEKMVLEPSTPNSLTWGNKLHAILKDENGKINTAQTSIADDKIEIDFSIGEEYEISSGASVDFTLAVWFNRFEVSGTQKFAIQIPVEHEFISTNHSSTLVDTLTANISSNEIEIVEAFDGIQDIRNGVVGQTYLTTGYVSSGNFGVGNSQFYIQKDDSSAYEQGIAVYSDSTMLDLNQGNRLKVLGVKEEVDGNIRMNADTIIMLDDEEFIPETYPISPFDFNTASELIGTRVQLDSLVLSQPDLWSNLTESVLQFTKGEDTVTVTIEPNNIYFEGNAQVPLGAVNLQGVIENRNDTFQLIVTADHEIDDTYPPVFEIEPEIVTIESEEVALNFAVNELSTVYYVIKNVEDSVPNFEVVKNPQNDQQILASGNEIIDLENTGDSIVNSISGLSSNTEYSAYVVAEDTLGNFSSIIQIDFFTLNADADEDVAVVTPSEQISALDINALEASQNFTSVFNFTVEDGGTNDELSTYISQMVIHSSSGNSLNFNEVLADVQLYDLSAAAMLNTQDSIFSDSIVFELEEGVEIIDGASNTFQLKIKLNEIVEDEQNLSFEIPAAQSGWEVQPNGSQLAENIMEDLNSPSHTIDVVATELNITYPQEVYQDESFDISLSTIDVNGNLDRVERIFNLTTESDGEILGQTELTLNDGNGVYENLRFSETGEMTLEITDSILTETIVINFIKPLLSLDTAGFNTDFGLINFPENSDVQSYFLSESNLKDSIIVISPEAFKLSLDSDFTIVKDTLVIDQVVLSPLEIFVRFSPTASTGAFYQGNITHLSEDADSVSLSVQAQEGTLSLSSIELIKDKPLGERVKVRGIVIGGNNHFEEKRIIQDETAGIVIEGLNSSSLNYGDSVEVEAVLTEAHDWLTLIPEQEINILSTDSITIEPLTITLGDVNSSVESQRVRIENLDIEGEGKFEQGEYLIFDDEDTLQFKLNAENHPLIGEELPIGKVNFLGFIGRQNDEWYIYPELAEDLEIIPRDTILNIETAQEVLSFGSVLLDEVSEPISYHLQAENLAEDLQISVNENFEISLLENSDFNNELILPIDEIGDIPKISVYVRFAPINARGGEISEELVHSSGAQELRLRVNGFEEIVTSNRAISKDKILIYPNPVRSKLRIEFLDEGQYFYQLLGLNGTVLKDGEVRNGEFLDVEVLEAGEYLLKVSSNNQISTYRILKE
jgi:hypothetical protein